MQLISDSRAVCAGSLHCLHIAFFTFRVVSRISHSCVVWSETQARCSSFLLKHWLCFHWDCSVSAAQFANSTGHGAIEGTENWGCLFFFLVQYAVHKSLALKIIQFFSSFLLLLNGYIAVFFIKTLWIMKIAWALFPLLNTNLDHISSGDAHSFNFSMRKKNMLVFPGHTNSISLFHPACPFISNSYKGSMTLDSLCVITCKHQTQVFDSKKR